jgi:hypothetical protein
LIFDKDPKVLQSQQQLENQSQYSKIKAHGHSISNIYVDVKSKIIFSSSQLENSI